MLKKGLKNSVRFQTSNVTTFQGSTHGYWNLLSIMDTLGRLLTELEKIAGDQTNNGRREG
jgi:hypothetical protein